MKQIKGVEIINIKKFSDERGSLIKAVKKEYVKDKFGEVYITFTNPGSIRANHYHHKTTEWFYVIKGSALLLLEDNQTKDQKQLVLSSDIPQLIRVPADVKHAIKNTGKEDLILFAFADKPYDPLDTIQANLQFE